MKTRAVKIDMLTNRALEAIHKLGLEEARMLEAAVFNEKATVLSGAMSWALCSTMVIGLLGGFHPWLPTNK